jgi:hypothetical protein
MTPHRSAATLVLIGWALLYSRHGTGARVVEEFPYRAHCERAMDLHVDRETQREIGGALAVQAPDNPMRKAAYGRAERHVRDRYRCESDG